MLGLLLLGWPYISNWYFSAIYQPNVTIFHKYILRYTTKALTEPIFSDFCQGRLHTAPPSGDFFKLFFLGYLLTKCKLIAHTHLPLNYRAINGALFSEFCPGGFKRHLLQENSRLVWKLISLLFIKELYQTINRALPFFPNVPSNCTFRRSVDRCESLYLC